MQTATQPPQPQGILPDHQLEQATAQGIIQSDYTIPKEHYQPATLDLRLGETAHILQASFLPHDTTVDQSLREFSIGTIDLRDGAILERNRSYLIPLLEHVDLPEDISGRTNPKSSTGRADIFTRVITDQSDSFDIINPGYQGKLYLELFSRSFTIKVRTHLSLNQLRLTSGDPACPRGDIAAIHQATPIIYPPIGLGQYNPAPTEENTISLSICLQGPGTPVGYKAKKNSALLDLTKTAAHNPKDYWEPAMPEQNGSLILQPEDFYLAMAAEPVTVPHTHAAELTAYETSTGELRAHYAGFFDPGFGYTKHLLLPGIRPAMEIRAHDVPFVVSPGQKVATLTYQKLQEPPDRQYGVHTQSSYHADGRLLSKHFTEN